MRQKLFTVTIKDCEVQTFRCGGNGGQNVNKRNTGVRIIHKASGAIGEGRDQRTQIENKRSAFRRMGESKQFQNWLKIQAARLAGFDPDKEVEREMQLKNLKIEIRNDKGEWEISPHLRNDNMNFQSLE